MPRVTATPVAASPDGVAVTFTAADATNKQQVPLTGREMVLCHNTGAGSRSVTITSAPLLGRVKDVTFSIPAGAWRLFGPYPTAGWRQTDGKLYFEAAHAEVEFTVIRLPA